MSVAQHWSSLNKIVLDYSPFGVIVMLGFNWTDCIKPGFFWGFCWVFVCFEEFTETVGDALPLRRLAQFGGYADQIGVVEAWAMRCRLSVYRF